VDISRFSGSFQGWVLACFPPFGKKLSGVAQHLFHNLGVQAKVATYSREL
jgi:hypothetical protein